MRSTRNYLSMIVVLFAALAITTSIKAQTTSFAVNGAIPSSVNPATDTYEMEFKLFDQSTGGAQVGQTIAVPNVAVKNRSFTVVLDFGSAAFPGADRFLEVSFRRPGTETFIVMARQQFFSAPYAVRSLSSKTADAALTLVSQSGTVNPDDLVQTNDPRLSDSRSPTPGSSHYIQNGNAQQSFANFNIDGSGTLGGKLSANDVNAATGYSIDGQKVLSISAENTFTGLNAGKNTTGNLNSFFGMDAGHMNVSGAGNSFFGRLAGAVSETGHLNSFFGESSGLSNTTGSSNSFFGQFSGRRNTDGANNSFFGREAGRTNISGSNNTMVGTSADVGSGNLSFATAIGAGSFVSSSNTVVLGRSMDTVQVPGNLNVAGTITGNLNVDAANITGILSIAKGGTGLSSSGLAGGFLRSDGAQWSSSPILAADIPSGSAHYIRNSPALQTSGNFNIDGTGSANLINSATHYSVNGNRMLSAPGSNIFVGYEAGRENTTGSRNAFLGALAGRDNETGSDNTIIGTNATGKEHTSKNTLIGASTAGGQGAYATAIGAGAKALGEYSTAIGAGSVAAQDNTVVLGRDADTVDFPGIKIKLSSAILAHAGSVNLCHQNGIVGTCSSSLRFKTDVKSFSHGLSLIERLQPIAFRWKDGGMLDVGLGAEDVAKVEPLLAVYDESGAVQGVKYDRIGVVLVNAVKEQQAQIARQQKLLDEQTAMIKELRRLMCERDSGAEICK